MSQKPQTPSDHIPDEPLVATIIPEAGYGAQTWSSDPKPSAPISSAPKPSAPKPRPVPPPPSPPFIRATPGPGGEPLPPFLFHGQQVTACASLTQWQSLLSQAAIADVWAEAEQAKLPFKQFAISMILFLTGAYIGNLFSGLIGPFGLMIGGALGGLVNYHLLRRSAQKLTEPNPENREIPNIVRDTITPLILLLKEELGPDHPLRLKLDLRDLYLPTFQWHKTPKNEYQWFKHSPILGAIRLPRGVLVQWRITEQCRVYTRGNRRSRSGRHKPDKVKHKLKCSLNFQILASAQKVRIVEHIPPEVQVSRRGNLIRLQLRMLSEVRSKTTEVTPGDMLDGITCLLALLKPVAVPVSGFEINASHRESAS